MARKRLKKSKKTLLIEKWRNPAYKGSLQGPYRFAREYKLKPKDVISYLKGRDGYTLHKQPRRRFKRRKIVASTINAQWVGDLLDLQKLSDYNDNYKYILFYIDVVSRKLYGEPTLSKSADSILEATKVIFNREKLKPLKIQFDKGGEIQNNKVKKYFKDEKIKLFYTEDDVNKGALIERSNRNMKRIIHAYLTEFHTRRYLDVLQKIIKSYNDTYHSSIGMSPNEVNKKNVMQAIYHKLSKPPFNDKPAFAIGDYVRLLGHKGIFDRGYDVLWGEEIHRVKTVLRTVPLTYRVEDLKNELVEGSFYKEELQRVKYPDQFFIEKVLDYRVVKDKNKKPVNEVLVRWLGYPAKFDQWLPEKDVKGLEAIQSQRKI